MEERKRLKEAPQEVQYVTQAELERFEAADDERAWTVFAVENFLKLSRQGRIVVLAKLFVIFTKSLGEERAQEFVEDRLWIFDYDTSGRWDFEAEVSKRYDQHILWRHPVSNKERWEKE
jgi:hypothetical protein